MTLTDELGRKLVIVLMFAGLLYLGYHQQGVIADLEAERESLKASLEAERKAATAANDETRKLTARIAEMRRKAARKEDQLNATIKQKAQGDPCLERRVDAAIIEQLRGSAAGPRDTRDTRGIN